MKREPLLIALICLLVARVPADAQMYIFGRADFAVGNAPTAVTTGDFNGDGLMDLAVTNSNDNTVSILLGRGNGTFAPQVTYATGSGPLAVVTGDFNADGNLDLAVANGRCNGYPSDANRVCSGNISILLGNGDGSFQSHVDYAAGTFHSSLATADFNRDGRLDLAVGNAYDRTVSVLIGNGDGTFQTQLVFATAGGDTEAQSVITGDFNGDGVPDLAVSGGVVSVLLGNGDGTFRAHLDADVGGTALTTGDLNHDGKLDLVVTAFSGSGFAPAMTQVLLGNGDGTFYVQATYGEGVSVTLADLNDDGNVDLVIAGYWISGAVTGLGVLLGNGDGTFQPAFPYGAGEAPAAVAVGDVNGDGKLDIVAVSGVISVLLGFGDGTFVGQSSYEVGDSPVSITAADFNRDGTLDLATANMFADTASVLLGSANGTFQSQAPFKVGHLPTSITAGDFRGNGNVDLVVANEICSVGFACNPGTVSVLLGNGNGTFGQRLDYGVGFQPSYVIAADFRGNGKLDIAVANRGSGTVSILLGNGDGTFEPQKVFPTLPSPQALAVGDFNQDGKLDLAVAGSGSASILLGNGDGTFRDRVDYPQPGIAIATGDFNGDSKLDFVTGGATPLPSNMFIYGVVIFLGRGDGTFQSSVNYPAAQLLQSIAVGDFNEDGKPDLAVGDSRGEVFLLLGNGDGTFQRAIFYGSLAGPNLVLGDFNGDGTLDWAGVYDTNWALPFPGQKSAYVMLSAAFKAISPRSLNFGFQGVGTTSTPLTLTISNPSNVKIEIASISSSGKFAETNNCGTSMSPGGSCAVQVTFSPSTTGAQSGAITISDSTRISPLAIPVNGSGVNGSYLTIRPARQNFSPVALGKRSSPAAVTLANTGNAALTITGISIAGKASSDFSQTNNCSSLSAGQSCTATVTFTPTARGSRVASLSISDTAPGSPHSAILEGTGIAPPDFTLTAMPESPTSQTISTGQTATFKLMLTPTGPFTGAVNLSCGITPVVTPAPTCTLSSGSVQISGGTHQTVSVTVGTTAPASTGTVSHVSFPQDTLQLIWPVALLWAAMLLLPHRKRLPTLAAPVIFLALASLVGCGGNSSPPPPHISRGTPVGTYTVTISASSGSLNHSMAVQVIVQ